MRKILYLSFCILTIICICAEAQVPGFMGKRFTIFLDANPTPALAVKNSNNKAIVGSENNEVSAFAFNFRPQVNIEYLVHRDIGIGFSYSRIMHGTTKVYVKDPVVEGGYSTKYFDHDVVRGSGVGVHFKFFNFKESSSIAPIGFYQTLSMYITQSNTYDSRKSKVKQFGKDFTYPVATYSWGRQSMIARNLLLKSGVEFGYAFVPVNFLTESTGDWNVDEHSGYNFHGSLFGYYLFNVNVALGYTF